MQLLMHKRIALETKILPTPPAPIPRTRTQPGLLQRLIRRRTPRRIQAREGEVATKARLLRIRRDV